MAGNSFGKLFKLSTFGESHGTAIGGTIDGCPANISISIEKIQTALDRRKPGQSKITTDRKEADQIEILSGVFEGKTTGTPIGFIIKNKDARSKDYSSIKDTFRPSHADFTYQEKYGIRDYRGGGRSSARETATRVAAGAIASQVLENWLPRLSINAYVSRVKDIAVLSSYSELDFGKIESNIVRCPEKETADKMIAFLEHVKATGDTVGGTITCVIKNCPIGLGEPVFDKFHANLGKAMLSINAVKGFEYGSGFEGTYQFGSEQNDTFQNKSGKVSTKTNNSGGIQGGISNGMDIYFNVAFKPIATINKSQETIDSAGKKTTIAVKGRHDPCVLPRAVPIVEAMAALTILDFLMKQSMREKR